MCASLSVSSYAHVEATPCGLIPKGNPDRKISADSRLISDLRRVNLCFGKTELYHAIAPMIYEIAEEIPRLKRKNHGLDIVTCKRDIEAAFARLFIKPDMIRFIDTELRAEELRRCVDFISGHLCLPFGWVGSHAFFQMFASASGARFKKFGRNRPRWTGASPFNVWTYVDDAMLSWESKKGWATVFVDGVVL